MGDLLASEKLKCSKILSNPIPLSEFNLSDKAWAVLRNLSPAVEELLLVNGFQVKKDAGGIFLVAITDLLENFGLVDLTELLELMSDTPCMTSSSCIPRPNRLKEYFKDKSHKIVASQGFIPSMQGIEKTLRRLKEVNISACPHGFPFKNRVYRIPTNK